MRNDQNKYRYFLEDHENDSLIAIVNLPKGGEVGLAIRYLSRQLSSDCSDTNSCVLRRKNVLLTRDNLICRPLILGEVELHLAGKQKSIIFSQGIEQMGS